MIIELNSINPDFETAYLQVRKQEGRLLTDEQVVQLPQVKGPFEEEWKLRATSAAWFRDYLSKRFDRPFTVLEIGCGNGWFCNFLNTLDHAQVKGLDVNKPELEQADRLFGDSIDFFLGSLMADDFQFPEHVDVIIFNASFQYFEDPDKVLDVCKKMLKTGGEVHILDTSFYHPFKLKKARERSQDYYTQQRVPAMSGHYHHHSTDFIQRHKGRILKSPSSRLKRLLGKPYPFYWVSFT